MQTPDCQCRSDKQSFQVSGPYLISNRRKAFCRLTEKHGKPSLHCLQKRSQWHKATDPRRCVTQVQASPVVEHTDTVKARSLVVVAGGALSPLAKYEEVLWKDVMLHIAKRLSNIDKDFLLAVFTDSELKADQRQDEFLRQIAGTDLILVVGIQDAQASSLLVEHARKVNTALYFNCKTDLQRLTKLDGMTADSSWMKLFGRLWLTRTARIKKLLDTVQELWARQTSDDLLFIFLVLIDSFIVEVETVRALRAQDLQAVKCMISNCGSQILGCLSTPECRAALDCLQQCAPNDQVCSYRCIASYETPQFEAFSLCVLQKHNCLSLHVKIPSHPNPAPMTVFRDATLSHETAEELFIGWLGNKQWSWRVVAGQNAAYDQFPCQFQLFYRGKAKHTLWYDPIFQVRTLDDRTVWRRRHYRVRRAEIPGSFRFSVLDNGVTSNELWRILDVPDDLSWALFFYSGAASVVGQSYTGAVLCTPDGAWPEALAQNRISSALERADIKTWELFRVDNSRCQEPPLGLQSEDSLGLTSS